MAILKAFFGRASGASSLFFYLYRCIHKYTKFCISAHLPSGIILLCTMSSFQPPCSPLHPAELSKVGRGCPAPPALPEAPPLLQLFASNPAPQILLTLGKLLCPKSLGYFKFPALKCAFRMNAFSLENAATLWIMG